MTLNDFITRTGKQRLMTLNDLIEVIRGLDEESRSQVADSMGTTELVMEESWTFEVEV